MTIEQLLGKSRSELVVILKEMNIKGWKSASRESQVEVIIERLEQREKLKKLTK